jgi:hypothetical protein
MMSVFDSLAQYNMVMREEDFTYDYGMQLLFICAYIWE